MQILYIWTWTTSIFCWLALVSPPSPVVDNVLESPVAATDAPPFRLSFFICEEWVTTSSREIRFLTSNPILMSMTCTSCSSCWLDRISCTTCAFKRWHSVRKTWIYIREPMNNENQRPKNPQNQGTTVIRGAQGTLETWGSWVTQGTGRMQKSGELQDDRKSKNHRN